MPENVVFAVEDTDQGEFVVMPQGIDLKQLIDLKPDSREMGGLGKDKELPLISRDATNLEIRNAALKGSDGDGYFLYFFLWVTCFCFEWVLIKLLERQIGCCDQQKEDNQHEAKTGHLSTTSRKIDKLLVFMSVCVAVFCLFMHQKEPSILHNNPNVRESWRMFDPRDDDDASCRLAGIIVLLLVSLLLSDVEHLLGDTPHLFIQLMRVFIWLGIVSGISVVLLWLLRLPEWQGILLLIAILSTIGSYACAIAVFLPFKSLRAPFWLLLSPGSVSTCLCS